MYVCIYIYVYIRTYLYIGGRLANNSTGGGRDHSSAPGCHSMCRALMGHPHASCPLRPPCLQELQRRIYTEAPKARELDEDDDAAALEDADPLSQMVKRRMSGMGPPPPV